MINTLKITTGLIKRRHPDFEFRKFNDTPITPLTKPVKDCKLALVTTGGLHLKTDVPFDLHNRDGDCSFRVLPGAVGQDDLAISHKWYNHKFINADINCVFPIDRMRESVTKGKLGNLSEEHYSFMGHIYSVDPLIKNARSVGRRLKKLDVDIAFLTPT